ncbi:hypothetical protein ACFC0C_16310 [Streptomyces sp. NPDC056178]|uniref:hypothetical protein n=1 Tax=unclassified Streptomyces TaxID=2593676 RepID=UPI0035E325D9
MLSVYRDMGSSLVGGGLRTAKEVGWVGVVFGPAEDDAFQVSEVDDVGVGTEGVDTLVYVVLDL